MNYFSRKNIIGWIVGILIIVNIGAISVFAYHIYFKKDFSEHRPQQPGPDSFMVHELGFDKMQSEQFAVLKKAHMDKVHAFVAQIKQEKKLLADGVISETVDTLKLDTIADKIGVLYASIRKANTRHYLELKKICTPEQQKKLAEIFGNIFCCDDKMDCRDKGKGQHHCRMENEPEGCKSKEKSTY
ncbi:MAG: hypothetical protein WCM76_12490 [Bacteroidota bacterium]